MFANVITFIIVTIFCFPYVEGILFGGLIIYTSITILIGFIYLIVKNILIQKHKDNTS